MLSDVPNLALAFGYVNASWTLKADLTSRYLCRLLRHMDRHGLGVATPRPSRDEERRPMLEFGLRPARRRAAAGAGRARAVAGSTRTI